MHQEMKGAASLVLSTFIYSFFGVLTRVMGFSLPVFYAMWTREVVAVSLLLTFALLTHQWRRVQPRDWKWFVMRSLGGLLGFLGSFYSFYFLPLGLALFIFYGSSTIFGYIWGHLLFKEKMTQVKTISLVVALLGLYFIYSLNIQSANVLYMLLALASGAGASTWNVFSKKISGAYSDVQLNTIDLSFGLVFGLIGFFVFREQAVPLALNSVWLANLLFVVMFISTGQLMVYGFRHLDAQIGSLIMLTEILFGIAIGFLFYQEALSLFTFLGGLLILLAIILPEVSWKKYIRRGR